MQAQDHKGQTCSAWVSSCHLNIQVVQLHHGKYTFRSNVLWKSHLSTTPGCTSFIFLWIAECFLQASYLTTPSASEHFLAHQSIAVIICSCLHFTWFCLVITQHLCQNSFCRPSHLEITFSCIAPSKHLICMGTLLYAVMFTAPNSNPVLCTLVLYIDFASFLFDMHGLFWTDLIYSSTLNLCVCMCVRGQDLIWEDLG